MIGGANVAAYRTTAASGATLPRIMSEALSAIIRVEASRLAEIMRGMIEASIARKRCADELSRARFHLTTVMSYTKVMRCGRRCPGWRINL
jgi:hypothetical protein